MGSEFNLELMKNLGVSSLLQTYLGIPVGLITTLLIIITAWSLVWKGIALWKSSKNNHLIWFVVLLVINTLGILEILYIYVFSKISCESCKKLVRTKTRPKK